jgi:hypothetical protein
VIENRKRRYRPRPINLRSHPACAVPRVIDESAQRGRERRALVRHCSGASPVRKTTRTPSPAPPAHDFCHGLLHPDLTGPNRPGPNGSATYRIGIEGLYLGGAGCHGGPGITFIPGYNAAHQVLDGLG